MLFEENGSTFHGAFVDGCVQRVPRDTSDREQQPRPRDPIRRVVGNVFPCYQQLGHYQKGSHQFQVKTRAFWIDSNAQISPLGSAYWGWPTRVR
jgi:hypothetical protein